MDVEEKKTQPEPPIPLPNQAEMPEAWRRFYQLLQQHLHPDNNKKA
ncbi:hypothetical protein [Brevibacillus fulvus]|uniref:Uncharacterized protein n=1 Tax=Brevibacillus fulvus TaxID=1125967 RepID=A0A938XXN2_9BACL|nr:hypothetical protein [Brevibacillus fulvus]MBM7588839.1 hypothetical protein [Brevibacillus fulvus]